MRYVYNIINLTTSIYSVINDLRLFSRVKRIKITLHLLFAIKSYSFGVAVCHLFYTIIFFYTIFILCNSQLNIVFLKKFAHCEIFCKMFFFYSQIYLKAIFYVTRGFLYQLKSLILSVLLPEWNKTCCIELFLCQDFVKLLNTSLDVYSLFLSHVK